MFAVLVWGVRFQVSWAGGIDVGFGGQGRKVAEPHKEGSALLTWLMEGRHVWLLVGFCARKGNIRSVLRGGHAYLLWLRRTKEANTIAAGLNLALTIGMVRWCQ